MTAQPPPPVVFISYSSQDSTVAQVVCDTLETNGISCWIAPRNIGPSSDRSSIEGLNACQAVVLIFSSHSNESPQVLHEMERAVHQHLPLLPFRLEDVPLSPAMEYFISLRHWLDAFPPPLQPHIDRLVQAMQRLLTPAATAPTPPPAPSIAPAATATAHHLPRQVSSFIGREAEMQQVKQWLARTPLLTLLGTGGVGKTRLALQVAAEALPDYPDGVWLVELAALSDPSLVPHTVASALGLREEPGRTLIQTLTDYLKPKILLLVLDNCEHLVEACAHLVETLLRSCPQLKVLATSREPLNIAGETPYRVPSLPHPDPHALPTQEQDLTSVLLEYPAVRLFVERARAQRPGFALTQQNGAAVARICHQLEGIPLAIELAAARVKVLPVDQIASRLDSRLGLLTGGSRTAQPRQQTLRALIDWSYDLLSEPEKRLLARLSVFAGGWGLEAAEYVVSDKDEGGRMKDESHSIHPSSFILHPLEVLNLLTSLVDKSLIIAEIQEETTRYRLLETIRQYAQDRLAESGESEQVRAGHKDYFLGLAEKALPLLSGSDQAHWLNVLEIEHDNLRQALAFCLEEEQEGEAGLRLGAALQRFWWMRGYLSEGRQYLTALLSRTVGPEPKKARANALNSAGVLASMQGDYAVAHSLMAESLTLFRELGDKGGIANCLNALGIMTMEQGDYAAARALYEQSLTNYRELGKKGGIAFSLNNLGLVAYYQSDFVAAHAYYEESLPLLRELGEKGGIAACLSNLGIVALKQGDYAASSALQTESLAIRRELGDKGGIANCLHNLGLVAQEQGDYAAARSLLGEGLAIRRELEDKGRMAECLDAFASLARQEQQGVRAARLWGAITALREAIGFARPPMEQEQLDHEIAQVRSALGAAAFTAAYEEGHTLPLEQAVAYALEGGE